MEYRPIVFADHLCSRKMYYKYDIIELQVIYYYWKAINTKSTVNVFPRTPIKVFIAIMLCGSLQINNHAIKAAPADILPESLLLCVIFATFGYVNNHKINHVGKDKR